MLRQALPLPFLPAEWYGKEILALAVCYCGADLEAGERVAKPLRAFGRPIADVIAPTPYVAWQTILDPLLAPGMRNYWKSHDFRELSDGLIDVFIDHARRIPDSANYATCIGWARDLYNSATPFATGGAYVNFLTQEEQGRVPAAYGDNYERLVAVKNRFDPMNLFSVNQNIRPTA